MRVHGDLFIFGVFMHSPVPLDHIFYTRTWSRGKTVSNGTSSPFLQLDERREIPHLPHATTALLRMFVCCCIANLAKTVRKIVCKICTAMAISNIKTCLLTLWLLGKRQEKKITARSSESEYSCMSACPNVVTCCLGDCIAPLPIPRFLLPGVALDVHVDIVHVYSWQTAAHVSVSMSDGNTPDMD